MAITKEQLEKLCKMFCTKTEIKAFFNASEKKLNEFCLKNYGADFSKVYDTLLECGKISLRRKQLKMAGKSAPMAIFLGKNYLGQKEQIENVATQKIEIISNVPIDEENGSECN